MKTTAQEKRYANQIFHLIFIVVLTVMGIYTSQAQVRSAGSGIKYKGFEVSFGSRSFKLNSDITKINGMKAGHNGGILGLVFGNDLLLTRVRVAGYFYSNSNTPYTQELFESAAQINFYPLAMLTKNQSRIRPYLTTGLQMDKVKFFGYYLEQGNRERSAYEPMLGKVSQLSASGGLGFEYSLTNSCDFINLFAEVNTAVPLRVSASNSAFSQTTMSQFTSVTVGVSFGINGKTKFTR